MEKIIHELNYLKLENFINIIVFIFSLPFIFIYKLYSIFYKKEIWLICEDKMEARDNGYSFFFYLRKFHKEINVYYAISTRSGDYQKVKKLGNTIKYGGIKHWVLYFNCKYNISSQKAGNPDAAICYVLERIGFNKNKNIFLQHGITINKAKWLFHENCNIRLFVCGAKPEYEYIKKYFGYPEKNVCYTGFSRFDNYYNIKTNKNEIVLMPSWREWIASKNEYSKKYEDTSDFTKTEYYQKYQSLINNNKLIEFLDKNNITMYFYPHRNMQKYINKFSTKSDKIRIVTNKDIDIKTLLIKTALMITDYSSVAMDFAYMKKPVIYYQFDEKRFREAQYEEGYFSYRNDGFGDVVNNEEELIASLVKSYKNNWKMSSKYEKKHTAFFKLCDNKNNDRIYKEIQKI